MTSVSYTHLDVYKRQVLGYELKTAVGTSVFIMAFTAFTGAASHFAIGGKPDWFVLLLCCLLYTSDVSQWNAD